MTWTTHTIAGRQCHILQRGTAAATYLWLYYPHRGNELAHMEEVLEEEGFDDITIAALQVEDWNRDLSPWQVNAMDGSTFPGGGPDFLTWIRTICVPWLQEHSLYNGKCILVGYSLAGLFAVWSLYETDLFHGAISGSGSFWIEGWREYTPSRSPKNHALVYLSLGGKEEKTRNPLMAAVGDRTRELKQWIEQDPMVDNCILEMNSGGHFADSVKRLVKGIRWMETQL